MNTFRLYTYDFIIRVKNSKGEVALAIFFLRIF